MTQIPLCDNHFHRLRKTVAAYVEHDDASGSYADLGPTSGRKPELSSRMDVDAKPKPAPPSARGVWHAQSGES